MFRVKEGEEEADGDGFDVIRDELGDDGLQGCEVQGLQNLSLGSDAFWNFKSPLFGHQWFRFLRNQGIQIGAILAANCQHIGETFGGDECSTGTAPF